MIPRSTPLVIQDQVAPQDPGPGDPLRDLVAAQEQRMLDEGRERRTRQRYAVWGDVPP
jgi:hypothetical protein